ncbi:hypothetical protein SLS62_009695 [Diatrype stigma]|uniref:Uncharacterized protein n=1 Tax=Diatrype stigma TaxID=117547 RepID=A0AAN9YJX1_9PEZI
MDQATNGEKSDGGQHIHYSHDHPDHRHLYNSLEQQLQLHSDRRRRRRNRLLRCLSLPLTTVLRPGPSTVLGALVCLFLSSSGGIALAIVLIVRQQRRWRGESGVIAEYGDEDGNGDGDGDVSLACLARDLVLFAAAMALLYIALHMRGARWGVYGCCSASDDRTCGSSSGGDAGGNSHSSSGGGNKSNRSSTSGGGVSSTGGTGTLPTTITTTTSPKTAAAAAARLPPHICGEGENYLRTSALLVARLAIAVWVGALVASAIVISRAPDGRRIGAVPVLNLIPFLILSATIEKKHPAPFATAGFSKPSFLTCRISAFADDLEASAAGGDRDAADSEALLNMSISRRASIERAKQQTMKKNSSNNLPPPSPPQPSYNPGGWRSEWNDVAEQVGVSCRIPVSESDYSARVAEENGTGSGNNSNNVAPPAPTYITSCYSSSAYAAPPQNAPSSLLVPPPPLPPPVPLKLSKGGPVRGNINVQHNTDNRYEQKQKQAGHDPHNLDHHTHHHNFNPNPNPNPNYNHYNYNYHHNNGNNYIPKPPTYVPPPPPPPMPSTSIASGERRSGLSTVRYAARPDVAVQQPLRVFAPAPPAPADVYAPAYAPISIPAPDGGGGSAAGGNSSGNRLYAHNRPTTAFTSNTTTVGPPPPRPTTARTSGRVYTAFSPDTSRRITGAGAGAGADVDIGHGLDAGRTNQSVIAAAPPPPPPHTSTTTIGYESYGYSTMRPELTTGGETITTTTTTTATTDPATAAVSMLRNAQRAQKVRQQQRGHLVGLGILGNGRPERGEECDNDDSDDKDKAKWPEVKIPGAYRQAYSDIASIDGRDRDRVGTVTGASSRTVTVASARISNPTAPSQSRAAKDGICQHGDGEGLQQRDGLSTINTTVIAISVTGEKNNSR